MNSRDEMKVVRNWLRAQMTSIKNDPFLSGVAPFVSARIVKWNSSTHSVLVCVRDVRQPETPYNSQYCRWIWVETWVGKYSYFKWNIWKELNDLVVQMQHPVSNDLPF